MKLDKEKIQKTRPIRELIEFGIVNIDKPLGPTSFIVSQHVANAFKLNKTSHVGTLDPTVVSGVLPILMGRACRLSDFFMHKNKTYVGVMRIHKEVSDDELKTTIKEFIGKITQLPPLKSNVKREERIREVVSFNILDRIGHDVGFETEVQAGTYIRKLIHDMGEKIGGAHMIELRRTKASIFTETDLYTLYEFDRAVASYKAGDESLLRKMIVPADWALLQVLPQVQVRKDAVKQLLTGKPLMKKDLAIKKLPESEVFAVFQEERLLMVAKKHIEKDILARPLFVIN